MMMLQKKIHLCQGSFIHSQWHEDEDAFKKDSALSLLVPSYSFAHSVVKWEQRWKIKVCIRLRSGSLNLSYWRRHTFPRDIWP